MESQAETETRTQKRRRNRITLSPREEYFNRLLRWTNRTINTQMHFNWFQNYSYMTYLLASMQMQHLQLKERHAAEAAALARAREAREVRGQKKLAPFYKRVAAQFIDVCIVMLISVLCHSLLDISLNMINDLNVPFMNYNISFDTDYDWNISWTNVEPSYTFLRNLIASVLIFFVYESLWTFVLGATPGKYLMNIRIIHVNLMQIRQPYNRAYRLVLDDQVENARAYMYPATRPGLVCQMFRTICKNVIIFMFVPLAPLMFYHQHNRTIFDFLTCTAVVELVDDD